MIRCGHCTVRYEGSWAVHTRSPEHQSWMRATGQVMAYHLANLDRIYDGALAAQKQREKGQLGMFDQ